MKMDILYSRDAKGREIQWQGEVIDNRYRTINGLVGGNLKTSEWTECGYKNYGKSNEVPPEEQAIKEMEAMYAKKLRTKYSVERGAIHETIKPMLAVPWKKMIDRIDYHKGVFVQPKLDGIRCLATKDGLFSRTGKEIVAVPHVFESLRPFFEENPDTILDGELYNHDLRDNFNEITSIVRKQKVTQQDIVRAREGIQYHMYDCIVSKFPDLDFESRFHRLITAELAAREPHIVTVDTTTANSLEAVNDLYSSYIGQGYEGGIVRVNGRYENKRSNLLIKRKDFFDEEFDVISIEEGTGNWAGLAKRVVLRHPNGNEFGAGMMGSKDYAKYILDNAQKFIGKQATVQYFELTPGGVPRHGTVKQFHEQPRW